MTILNLSQSTVWNIKQAFALLISAVFLLWIYPKTHLDFDLINPYFDAENKVFSLKHDVFLVQVMHFGLKYLVISIALTMLSLVIFGGRLKLTALVRLQLGWAFLGMILSTFAVAAIKSQSMHACPWDLTDFGGKFLYYPLLANLPNGAASGHCWPGAHASGGFALMAIYFAFRQTKPLFACSSLVISLILGFVMGWAQMIRGAHFLSHTLWAAWVVWLVLVLLNLCYSPNKKREKNPQQSLIFSHSL